MKFQILCVKSVFNTIPYLTVFRFSDNKAEQEKRGMQMGPHHPYFHPEGDDRYVRVTYNYSC